MTIRKLARAVSAALFVAALSACTQPATPIPVMETPGPGTVTVGIMQVSTGPEGYVTMTWLSGTETQSDFSPEIVTGSIALAKGDGFTITMKADTIGGKKKADQVTSCKLVILDDDATLDPGDMGDPDVSEFTGAKVLSEATQYGKGTISCSWVNA